MGMGRPVDDLAGQRFGHVRVIRRVPDHTRANRGALWYCKCDCGRDLIAYASNLKRGRTNSCGCMKNRDYVDGMDKEQMRKASSSIDNLTSCDDPYQDLANAIVAVAADDYRMALKIRNKGLKRDLEEFFHSDWYGVLTNVDADALIECLQKERTQGIAVAISV